MLKEMIQDGWFGSRSSHCGSLGGALKKWLDALGPQHGPAIIAKTTKRCGGNSDLVLMRKASTCRERAARMIV